MPIIAAGKLEDTIRRLLAACGTPDDEAEIVARHVVDANLCGHDSHGAIQIPIYIDRVEKGHIVPGAPFEIVPREPDDRGCGRPLGLRLRDRRACAEADHGKGGSAERRRLHDLPPEPCRAARRLSDHGRESRLHRHDDRRLRPLAQERGAVRRRGKRGSGPTR